MIVKISKSEEFQKKLKKEGRFRYFGSKKDLEIQSAINTVMRKVRREYIIKNAKAIESASKRVFNA